MIADALSTTGHGYLAASAGGAEVQMPLVFGSASATLTALLLVLSDRRQGLLNYSPSSLTLLVAAAVGVLIALNVGIIQWAARPGAIYSPALASVARTASWIAAGVVVCAALAVPLRSSGGRMNEKRPRLLLAVAAVNAIVGTVIALLATQLLKLGAASAG
jgi:hypothetical protein